MQSCPSAGSNIPATDANSATWASKSSSIKSSSASARSKPPRPSPKAARMGTASHDDERSGPNTRGTGARRSVDHEGARLSRRWGEGLSRQTQTGHHLTDGRDRAYHQNHDLRNRP